MNIILLFGEKMTDSVIEINYKSSKSCISIYGCSIVCYMSIIYYDSITNQLIKMQCQYDLHMK